MFYLSTYEIRLSPKNPLVVLFLSCRMYIPDLLWSTYGTRQQQQWWGWQRQRRHTLNLYVYIPDSWEKNWKECSPSGTELERSLLYGTNLISPNSIFDYWFHVYFSTAMYVDYLTLSCLNPITNLTPLPNATLTIGATARNPNYRGSHVYPNYRGSRTQP